MNRREYVSQLQAEQGSVLSRLIEGFWLEDHRVSKRLPNKQWAYWLLIRFAKRASLTDSQITMANNVRLLSADEISNLRAAK